MGFAVMQNISKMPMDELIELGRVGCSSGREPWLCELPVHIGKLLAAMSYFESYAGQIAGPWIENVMTEKQLWDFSLISSFDRVEECAASIQELLDVLRCQKETEALAHHTGSLWVPLRAFVDRLKVAKEPEGFAWQVLMFLVAAMVMRQDLEAKVRDKVGVFSMASDSVCREYMDTAIVKAGDRPFGCQDGTSIDSLRQAVINGLAASSRDIKGVIRGRP
jgi:hypothetical protein